MAIRDQNKALRNGVSDGELCSAMVRLSSLALSKTDPDRIISEALREIRKTLGTRICWMFLVEEDRTILKGLGDAASPRGPAGSELLLKLSPKILKRTYPIICNRIGELYKENRVLHRFLHQRNIEKFMGVPLKKDGRSIGVLNVGRGRDARDFTREDLKSLTMLGSVLVVSRMRAAESESKQAQSFLEGIIDNIPNPVFIKDRKHRYVVLNQAFSELVGHSRKKMLGKSDYDFFPKDQADFFCKKDEEMFRTGKVVDIPEEPVTDKDGKLHHLHTKKAPLKDSSGKIIHLVGIIEDVTERKRAEEALKESEEHFRLMAETSLEYSFQTDKNGTTIYCSPAIEHMLGYTPEERVGMDFSSIILPSDVSKAQVLFRKVKRGETIQDLEISLRHKSGKTVVVEVSVVPILQNKEMSGLYGVARDITERKKAEGALKESEEKYRLLIENSDAAITFFDKNGTYLFLNSLAANWLKGKPEDYIGKTVYDTFTKGLAGKFVKRFRRIIKSGVGETFEEVVELPPGGRLISSNLQPVRDQSGKIAGVQIVTHDITERKRAEEALRESENKYRMLLENLPQRIFFKDENSVYISCNDNFAQDLNIKPDEITGKTDYDFFPKELAEKYDTDDKRIMKSGKMEDIEETYIQDGQKVFVHTVKTPVKDKSGHIAGILGIFWNITERRRAEKALIQNERTARERARLLTDLRDLDQIDNILARVCQAVRDSGLFERAVITLHDQARQISYLGQIGLPPDLVRRARRAPPLDQKTRARITSKKFRISDSFFVPAEAGVDFSKTGRHVPQKKGTSVGGDWQPGDELFVPLRDFSGKIMGFLSVDTPTDGCRPDIKTLEALEMLVEAAASRVREMEAQEVLKQERDFSQSILETANSLIVCLDADAKITVFNQECERVTGYRSEEVTGKRWPELCLPPDHHHFKLKSFVKWVRAHPSDRYEGPIVTKSGEIRTILWSNTAILGPDENEIVAIAIGHDVTERKRAEEALKISEQKFKDLTETTTDWVWEVDEKGVYTYVSPKVKELLGYEANEVLGKTPFDLMPEGEKERIARSFKEITIKKEPFYGLVNTNRHKDGHLVVLETNGIPILDKTGRLRGYRGIDRDITERKRAEEEIRKFKTISDRAGYGSAISDLKGNLIYVNESFARMHGYRPEELVGKHLSLLHQTSQLKDVNRLNRKLMREGSYVAEEV
ncbi:MAG: PAS domain S-box protein, partial [Candidatus Zixiibacteriota bacterium]